MTPAAKLRAKLLDLAIRGKLVAQDPNDEPAEELLKRIFAAKTGGSRSCATAMVGSRVPRDRIGRDASPRRPHGRAGSPLPAAIPPPIPPEEQPFALPKGWVWCRIGDICTGFQYGTARKSAKDGKVPVLRMGNLRNGEIDYSDLVFTSDAEDIKQYSLVSGDLLFNRTNSSEKVGKVSIFRGGRECIFAGYLVRFHPVICDSDYVNYVMNSYYQWDFCQAVKSDAVNQSNISASKFVQFPIPLPPLAEQKRIVEKLETLLKAVDTLGTCAEKFDKLGDKARAKILDLAIRGKLVAQNPADEPADELLKRIFVAKAGGSRSCATAMVGSRVPRDRIGRDASTRRPHGRAGSPLPAALPPPIPSEEQPFALPKGWVWCRFADVLNYIRPDGYIVKCEEYCNRYETPVLTAGLSFILGYTNETDGHFMASKENPVVIFDDFTTSTQWVDFEFKVKSSAMKILEPCCRDLVDMKYLFFAIKNVRYTPSTHSRQWIDKFSKFPFALPPLAEQKRIVAKVEALLAACEKLKGAGA